MTQTKIAVGMVDASGTPGSGNFLRGDGAWNAAGAWNLIGTSVASSSASLTITGLDSTYDTYVIALADMVPATDGVIARLGLGDSSGIDSGASDYGWGAAAILITASGAGAEQYVEDTADTHIDISGLGLSNIGNAASEGYGGMLYLHRPGDGNVQPIVTGQFTYVNGSGVVITGSCGGARLSVITLDRVQFLFSSGNIATGRMTVWGLAHA
jgi:hypothetical protein